MKSQSSFVLCILLAFLPLVTQAAILPGKSLTNGRDPTLQNDICNAIFSYEHNVAPQSKHPRIVNTAVTVTSHPFKVDPQGKIVGLWVERWVAQRDDGTKQIYLVRLDAHGSAGTGFKIKPYTAKSKA